MSTTLSTGLVASMCVFFGTLIYVQSERTSMHNQRLRIMNDRINEIIVRLNEPFNK